jgi:hypothetical protein
MTTASFQPRHLGARLLVAPLGEDCLGSVYRALHASDERRFVRLRILQSPELSPAAVFSAVARHGHRVGRLSHKAIVQNTEFAIEEGTPFVCWYESAGWTLDFVLSKLRAAATPLPIPFGLLIAERVCAALEHAWFSPVDGEPIRHGVPWPGFVSISNDAEVRLGGFGLADAILPSLNVGRLGRDIAPYVAPEARESGKIGPTSDTYSAGVLLLELLTCRRPSAGPPLSLFRSEDTFPEGIRAILDRCFAPADARCSVLELHRALQEQLAAGPAPVSSADLAYFLYTLLNPESRALPTIDGESTNPVAADSQAADVETSAIRRRDDLPPLESDAVTLFGPDVEAPLTSIASSVPLVRRDLPERTGRRPFAARRSSDRVRRRLGGLAYFGAAAAVILAFEGLAAHRRAKVTEPLVASTTAVAAPRERMAAANEPTALPAAPAAPASVSPLPPPAPAAAPEGIVRATRSGAGDRSSSPAVDRSGRRRGSPSRAELAQARRSAEDARFRAAWARIEAERREASELAAEAFAQGKAAEAEAESHLRDGEFLEATKGFERAAELFRAAEDASRQARLARISLSAPAL